MKKISITLSFLVVFISSMPAQWQRVETVPTWTYFGGCIDALGDDFAVFTLSQTQMLITTDAGKTWTQKNLPESVIDLSLANKNTFYIACISGKFYKTTDGGNSWSVIFSNSGSCSMANYIEMFSETKGIAMGDGPNSSPNNGLFLKTTNGADWLQTCNQSVGFSGDRWTRLDFVDENTGYFYRTTTTVGQEKVLKTTDGGVSWTETNYNGKAGYGIKFYNKDYGFVTNYDFATSSNFVDRTTDGGTNWQRYNTAGSQRAAEIEFVPGSPSSVWLGANSGLYFSADSGKYWTQKIPSIRFDDIVFPTSKTGWALSPYGYLYYSNSGGIINDVNKEINLPSSFQLFQNYPNPFNPETVIRYQLSAVTYVRLKIFDLLGKEIATLVDAYQPPGIYNSAFSIINYSLPSGTYFYKLTAGDYSSTKKMTLLK